MKETKKDVYQFDDFRLFLKDYCDSARTENKKYSFRYFSRLAGFVSPSHIKRIIDGERNLSLAGIDKLAKALKLNNDENLFFKNLVLFNQSSNFEEKEKYAKELLRSRNYRKIHPLSQFQFKYFAKWYFVPVREMVSLPDFREDPAWIAKVIKPEITASEAKEALAELIAFGLLVRGDDGRLKQATSNVMFPDSITSSFYIRYHKEMLTKASQAIDSVPREKRDISNVTFGLSPQAMEKIKEMIRKFREEVLEVASKDHDTNSVYQLNLQLFPLVEVTPQALKEKK